jgi:hypothetical protein
LAWFSGPAIPRGLFISSLVEQINPAIKNNPNSPEFDEAQCPIGLKLKFEDVVEVSMSCSQFKIVAVVGKVVECGYEKDFVSRESTLAMGPRIDADIPGILDANASAYAFVKFDGNNQPIDAGLTGGVEIGVKGTTPLVSASYTMGINSGFNYSGKSPF